MSQSASKGTNTHFYQITTIPAIAPPLIVDPPLSLGAATVPLVPELLPVMLEAKGGPVTLAGGAATTAGAGAGPVRGSC
jgi:hypothetical protein